MFFELLRSRRRRTATRRNTRRSRPLPESLEGRQLLSSTPPQVYAALQQYQNQETSIIAENGTLNVGTFNPLFGSFAGLGGKSPFAGVAGDIINREPMLKPPLRFPIISYPTQTFIDALNVELTFHVTHSLGNFTVTANGTTVSAGPTANALTVQVGAASTVKYTVSSGSASYSGSFSIVRPPYMAVATIPIIPLAVVYDAPQGNSGGQNETELIQTSSRSTTVNLNYTTNNSTTTPGTVQTSYGDLPEVESVLNGASKVLSVIPGVPSLVSAGASLVSSLLGSVTTSNTIGNYDVTATTNGMTYSTTDAIIPTTHLGPGEGDVIEFITGAPFVMVGWNGQATTAELPGGEVQAMSVYFLKQRLASLGTSNTPDPVTGLDRTTIQALLSLDPLATGGPNAPLDPNRFAYLNTYGINGTQWTHTFSVSLSTSQMNASTQTVENLETDQSGLLGFLGIGVTDNKTTQVTVTNTSSQTNSSSDTVSATVTLNAGPDEYYQVQAYYDTVFGSVLLREVPAPPAPPAVRAPVTIPLIGLHAGGFLASLLGAKPLASATEPQRANATSATSQPAQPPIRPAYVVSDPASVPKVVRSSFVREDDL
jgi:hypothetical protein